jgi:hypothetical protein
MVLFYFENLIWLTFKTQHSNFNEQRRSKIQQRMSARWGNMTVPRNKMISHLDYNYASTGSHLKYVDYQSVQH